MKNTKFYFFVLGVFTFVYMAVQISSSFSKPYRTQRLAQSVYEDLVQARALFFAEETVVTNTGSGTVTVFVAEEERVAKDKLIASVYASNEDEQASDKINELKIKIEQMEQTGTSELFANDYIKLDAQINECMININMLSDSGHVEQLRRLEEDLTRLLIKRQSVSGDSSALNAKKDEYKRQLAELEKRRSAGTKDIYASQSGCFTASLDGYEGMFGMDQFSSLTPQSFAGLLEAKPVAGSKKAIGRLLTGYDCSGAVALPDAYKEIAVPGRQGLGIRISRQSNEILPIDILKTQDGGDGTFLVWFRIDMLPQGFSSLRKEEIELVVQRYPGFRIPQQALRLAEDIGSFTIDASDKDAVKTGNAYTLKVAGVDKVAVIRSMTDRDDGRVLVYFRFKGQPYDFSTGQVDQAQLTGEGARKVSVSSLKKEDGRVGMYVLSGHLIQFYEVNITYNGSDFMMVQPVSELLMEGDDVIIDGKNLYDGKVVG